MKKISLLLILAVVLSGCATYKYHLGEASYDNGYVVTRDYRTIVEYTIGKDNSVSKNLDLAKERFKRRKKTVEHYYRQMDIIESDFAKYFWTPCVLIGKTVVGVFRLPFIAYSDYKYRHDPEYREMVRAQDEEQDALEKARLEKLKSELDAYIQEDLRIENP
ncbi:MAG: hypothetical protein ABH954_02940 [Candidatus Omnitrophota bacterium]